MDARGRFFLEGEPLAVDEDTNGDASVSYVFASQDDRRVAASLDDSSARTWSRNCEAGRWDYDLVTQFSCPSSERKRVSGLVTAKTALDIT